MLLILKETLDYWLRWQNSYIIEFIISVNKVKVNNAERAMLLFNCLKKNGDHVSK